MSDQPKTKLWIKRLDGTKDSSIQLTPYSCSSWVDPDNPPRSLLGFEIALDKRVSLMLDGLKEKDEIQIGIILPTGDAILATGRLHSYKADMVRLNFVLRGRDVMRFEKVTS
jgi:hypothetical protein